jgi:hypothetical protein
VLAQALALGVEAIKKEQGERNLDNVSNSLPWYGVIQMFQRNNAKNYGSPPRPVVLTVPTLFPVASSSTM